MSTGERVVCVDAQGRAVFSYVRGEIRGKPWADHIEVMGTGSVEVISALMRGWVITASPELSGPLLARGAKMVKEGRRMSRDLIADPPPTEWADLRASSPLRITPCDRPAEEVISCWRDAYPPGHPDRFPGSDEEALRDLMRPLLAGTLYGPLRSESAITVDENDCVVGCVLVNETDGSPPYGGPWITELFRQPGSARAGLGALLLKRAIGRAAANGMQSLGLVVTMHNPAYRLYEAHGFQVLDRFLSVEMPEA